MLKPGSKIYDPGLFAQDPIFEFTKLITLHFKEEGALDYRYSYPMGIVESKKTTWQYDDTAYILSYTKGAGMMEPSVMKFVWKASYKITNESKSLILELKEVINNVGLETETKLDLSTIKSDILKREFISVSADDVNDNKSVKKNNYTIFTK